MSERSERIARTHSCLHCIPEFGSPRTEREGPCPGLIDELDLEEKKLAHAVTDVDQPRTPEQIFDEGVIPS